MVEKTFTPEQRRRMDELRPARMKVLDGETEVYDEALERMIAPRQDPPQVLFEKRTRE